LARSGSRSYEIAPSAARLTSSLRDIGYDFHTAVADLVDNSISAGATHVDITIEFESGASYVLIADNGEGMTANGLAEALRFGSRRIYGQCDLGRFGLGLKTASLSQCRRLTVVTRRSPSRAFTSRSTLDLDLIEEWDEWVAVEERPASEPARAAQKLLVEGPGTVVIWEKLDRVLPERYMESGWGRRRMAALAQRTAEHLAVVFHRFLAGLADGTQLIISVNGEKVEPWDPFALAESATIEMPPHTFEVDLGSASGNVDFRGYVLPPRDRFSSPEAFEALSGPLKWNRQQGLYVYRANRIIQFGGWNGLRAIDEHTKLARASIDFDSELDEAFQVNVAKMRVTLPASLRQMLERPVHELCVRASDVYRKTGQHRTTAAPKGKGKTADLADVGLALRAAALEAGQLTALASVFEILRLRQPELLKALRLD
jgi:hypothetical protein